MSDSNETENRGFSVSDRRGETKEEEVRKPEPTPPPKKEAPKAPRTGGGQIDFSAFVMSLSTSAAIHLGLVEDPISKKRGVSLELARQDIDILEMLAEKTKGNLVGEEAEMMEQVLYELRLRFVESSKR
ncbi:MAG: DUF1844 domain-containing protein [Pseudomonadota bacterium]